MNRTLVLSFPLLALAACLTPPVATAETLHCQQTDGERDYLLVLSENGNDTVILVDDGDEYWVVSSSRTEVSTDTESGALRLEGQHTQPLEWLLPDNRDRCWLLADDLYRFELHKQGAVHRGEVRTIPNPQQNPNKGDCGPQPWRLGSYTYDVTCESY